MRYFFREKRSKYNDLDAMRHDRGDALLMRFMVVLEAEEEGRGVV